MLHYGIIQVFISLMLFTNMCSCQAKYNVHKIGTFSQLQAASLTVEGTAFKLAIG